MFEVKNEGIRMTLLMSFLCLSLSFSSVYIVDFEHVFIFFGYIQTFV